MTPRPRVLSSIPLPTGGVRAGQRADVVLDGLEQAGPSFEVRVFVNNPSATAATKPAAASGYAGSVYVYGEGAPVAEIGTAAHPQTPMTRNVIATEAIRAAAAAGPRASVTLVPVGFAGSEPEVDLSGVSVSVVVV